MTIIEATKKLLELKAKDLNQYCISRLGFPECLILGWDLNMKLSLMPLFDDGETDHEGGVIFDLDEILSDDWDLCLRSDNPKVQK